MKNLNFLTLFALLSACATKKNMHDISYSKTENSLLWEISGNDLKQPSYLFGTIHLIGKDDFYLGEATKKALDASDLLITEIDMASLYNVNPADLMLTNDSTIRDFMTEDAYKKVKTLYMEKMEMSEDVFDKTLSRMLPIMLQQQITLLAFGENTKSYEMELLKLSKRNKTENIGLETQDFQVQVFKNIPIKEQVSMLNQTVDSLDKSIEEMNTLIELYKKENINELAEFMNSAPSGESLMKHKDVLLTNRNTNWIPKIEENIKEKSCFIAVGAAHLPMKNGVIELLKEKGYTVKALHKQ